MQNPESQSNLSPDVAFQYQNHTNIPWNIIEYQPLPQYIDPLQQIAQKKYQNQLKGKSDTKYKTKKGFYLDYYLKVMSAVPEPSHYNLKDSFSQQVNQKKAKNHKLDHKLIKYTYLQRIEMEQKNRKSPAPGDYNLNKSEDQIKQELKMFKNKKKSIGSKVFFYENFQNLSNSVPGMGSYHPHTEVQHTRPDKKDHKFWIDKHKKINQSFQKKRLSQPAPGSYTPCPLNVITFDRIKTADLINRRKKNIKQTGFGTDAKFPYERPNKIVIKQQRPTPISYDTNIEWKGKNTKTNTKSWARSLSTGFSQSIYN